MDAAETPETPAADHAAETVDTATGETTESTESTESAVSAVSAESAASAAGGSGGASGVSGDPAAAAAPEPESSEQADEAVEAEAAGPEPLDLEALADLAPRPDDTARTAARARLGDAAIAAAGLGRLEDLAAWIAAAQGASPTTPIRRARVVLFGGDHGVTALGVSASADSLDGALAVSAAQAKLVADGGGALGTLARLHDATVRVVDVSLGRPSGRIDVEDACTRAEIEEAFRLGMDTADAEIDSGADLLIPSLLGVGQSTVAAALSGVLTGKDAAAVTGRGAGIDDDTWMRKCTAVRDAMRRGRPVLGDQLELLARIADRSFAAASGFLLQAVVRRTPVILDGVAATACAMLVQRIAYRAPQWWLAGALSTEPAQKAALDRLSVSPLLPEYAVREAAGVQALLGLPIVRSAAALLAELPTFEEAGIPAPVLRSRI
jgi:nicotinate-nucleotide--dimethylbenzimidazole phosphoribosyltransferase